MVSLSVGWLGLGHLVWPAGWRQRRPGCWVLGLGSVGPMCAVLQSAYIGDGAIQLSLVVPDVECPSSGVWEEGVIPLEALMHTGACAIHHLEHCVARRAEVFVKSRECRLISCWRPVIVRSLAVLAVFAVAVVVVFGCRRWWWRWWWCHLWLPRCCDSGGGSGSRTHKGSGWSLGGHVVPHVLLLKYVLVYGGQRGDVVGKWEPEVFRPLFYQFPVAPVPGRVAVVSRPGDLIVDHIGHLVRHGLKWAFHGRGPDVSPLYLVSYLDLFLLGSVLFVEVLLGLELGLLVSFPGLSVVFDLGFHRDFGQLVADLSVEHQHVWRVSGDCLGGASVSGHILGNLLLQILSIDVPGVDDQLEVPVEPLHHTVGRWVVRCADSTAVVRLGP